MTGRLRLLEANAGGSTWVCNCLITYSGAATPRFLCAIKSLAAPSIFLPPCTRSSYWKCIRSLPTLEHNAQTSEAEPTFITTENDTAHTYTHADNEAGVTPTVASNAEARSLWEVAFEELSPQERITLSSLIIERGMVEIVSNLDIIRSDMEEILNGNQEKRWQLSFRGETIVMRDIGRKILKWVDKFKEVGDIIIQFDLRHAALPWAGFRFLLKVYTSR
ncbi:hypothetical protein BDD12DRAFT_159649 [Trichophaea hybrida]|nr:hypothetical protein BDD12DRAFT_159649 [Trichophaea hybrida]